jgi:hypothetical protein
MDIIKVNTRYNGTHEVPRKETIDELREWCIQYGIEYDVWTCELFFEHDGKECDELIDKDINELTAHIRPNTLEQNLTKAEMLLKSCYIHAVCVDEMDVVERRGMLNNSLYIYNTLSIPIEEQIRRMQVEYKYVSAYMGNPLYSRIREWEEAYESKIIEQFIKFNQRTTTK